MGYSTDRPIILWIWDSIARVYRFADRPEILNDSHKIWHIAVILKIGLHTGIVEELKDVEIIKLIHRRLDDTGRLEDGSPLLHDEQVEFECAAIRV
jgi:hypothetical protein